MSGDLKTVRILFLNHWARYLGGAEYSLIDIIKEINGKGKVYLVTSERGVLLDRLANTQITSKVITCRPNVLAIKRDHLVKTMLVNWRALVAFFIYFFRVLNFVRKINPDCIHANVPKSHIILCLLTVFGFRGNGIIHMREIFSKKSIVYLLYHYFFTISRLKVIAISRAVKESLPRNMQRETMVIYNGVFIPPEKESVFVVQPIKFLYLGRIVPWKGCHILLEAFTKLFSQCNKEATLTLTGATIYWDALYRQELFEHINKCNLNKAVVILEATDKPYQVIRNHHVLCMASSLEPFGRVAAEAQSCGLPVIGFSSGGLPEIVVDGKTGYLVPEGDADALTAVMAKFVADPKLISTLGENGRKRAEQLFNRAYQVPKIINYLLKGTVIGN